MSTELLYTMYNKPFALSKPSYTWAIKKLKRWASENDVNIKGLDHRNVLKKCCEYFFSREYKMRRALKNAYLTQCDLDKLEKSGYTVKIADFTPLLDGFKLQITNGNGKKVLQKLIKAPKEYIKAHEVPEINWFKEQAFEELVKFVKKRKTSKELREVARKKDSKSAKPKVKVKVRRRKKK